MMIVEMIKKLLQKVEEFTRPAGWSPIRDATPQKKPRMASRQNHSKGESKARRKMAAASNRINRRNVKGWKH